MDAAIGEEEEERGGARRLDSMTSRLNGGVPLDELMTSGCGDRMHAGKAPTRRTGLVLLLFWQFSPSS